VADTYDYMHGFIESVNGQLFKDRLFEVFQMLSGSLINTVSLIYDMSRKDCTKSKMKEFYKLIVRVNDV
jgi:hypothetical protein